MSRLHHIEGSEAFSNHNQKLWARSVTEMPVRRVWRGWMTAVMVGVVLAAVVIGAGW